MYVLLLIHQGDAIIRGIQAALFSGKSGWAAFQLGINPRSYLYFLVLKYISDFNLGLLEKLSIQVDSLGVLSSVFHPRSPKARVSRSPFLVPEIRDEASPSWA